MLAGEWRGKRTDYYSEWIQSKFRIPKAEYEKLAEIFNPIYFDADEWVKLAKDAGAEYLVVTSKHHEGFCLFKTAYNSFNVVDGTPFKRDVIKELAESCKRHGMKLGLYYSQDLDWHEPNGGFSRVGETNKGLFWSNNWDFPDAYMTDVLAESPGTLNKTWGFNYFDTEWKSADEVIRLKEHLNERGINYLLNVGPDYLGRIPVPAVEILREVGERIKK